MTAEDLRSLRREITAHHQRGVMPPSWMLNIETHLSAEEQCDAQHDAARVQDIWPFLLCLVAVAGYVAFYAWGYYHG